MALSADRETARKEGGFKSFPVFASTQIYKGAMVALNSSGYLVEASDALAVVFVGVAYENVLGTTSGAKWCKVYTKGEFLFAATSITQAMLGQPMFVKDDQTFDDTSNYYILCGRLVEYVSTTSGWIDIGQRAFTLDQGAGRLYRSIGAVTDELGALDYGELHITAAPSGHIYGRGSWLNIDGGTLVAGRILVPFEGGIYDGGVATITSGRLVFAGQHQAILTGTPGSLHAWRLNSNKTITALIAAANAGSIGYTAGTGSGTAVGWVAFCEVVGGPAVGYVKIYSATA